MVSVGTSANDRTVVLQNAIKKEIFPKADDETGNKPVVLFYDMEAYVKNLEHVKHEFTEDFLHAVAMKSNPLTGMLKSVLALGMGVECASLFEVQHGLRIGFPANKIVFDSPAKTIGELKFALKKGIHVNVDNVQELERVKKLWAEDADVRAGGSTVGVRVNPLVGAGNIAMLSVSTGDSKFGVPLTSADELAPALAACGDFISAVHVHVGSGGNSLDQLVEGARRAVELCKKVNELAGRKQITVVDIGGGLHVNMRDVSSSPSFASYSQALRAAVPELFDGYFTRVVTEFGQSLSARFGFVATRVEYAKRGATKNIAITHAGSDLFVRACYCPDAYPMQLTAHDATGAPKPGEPVLHDIAGPMCFAGDVVGRNRSLPPVEEGDYIIIHDAGANTMSLYSRHCSRGAPMVWGYKRAGEGFDFTCLKAAETADDVLCFWG